MVSLLSCCGAGVSVRGGCGRGRTGVTLCTILKSDLRNYGIFYHFYRDTYLFHCKFFRGTARWLAQAIVPKFVPLVLFKSTD